MCYISVSDLFPFWDSKSKVSMIFALARYFNLTTVKADSLQLTVCSLTYNVIAKKYLAISHILC